MQRSAFSRALRRLSSIGMIGLFVALALPSNGRAQSNEEWVQIKAKCGLPPDLLYNDWVAQGAHCPNQENSNSSSASMGNASSAGDPLTAGAAAIGHAIGNWLFDALFAPHATAESLQARQARALNIQGLAAFNARNYAEAANYFQLALSMSPNDAVIADNLHQANAAQLAQTRQAIASSLDKLSHNDSAASPSTTQTVPGLGFSSYGGPPGGTGDLNFSGAPTTTTPTSASSSRPTSDLTFDTNSNQGSKKPNTGGLAMQQAKVATGIRCPWDTDKGCPPPTTPQSVASPPFAFAPAAEETPAQHLLHPRIMAEQSQVRQLNTGLAETSDPMTHVKIKSDLTNDEYHLHIDQADYMKAGKTHMIAPIGESDPGTTGNGSTAPSPHPY